MSDTLLHRLFLDAQEELLAAVDHVPNPGRGGSIGSLNPAGWTVMHVAAQQSQWISLCAGVEPDGPTDDWSETAYTLPIEDRTPPYDEARAHLERVIVETSRVIETWSWDALLEEIALPPGAPPEWRGTTRAYLIARSVAHAFVHAGELTVLASLMARPDLGLPGALRRSSAPTTADDPSVPLVAALLRDAFVELRRVAVMTPVPAAFGAMDRLNPVSYTLAHVLHAEERLWGHLWTFPSISGTEGSGATPALAALLPDGVLGDARPLPWGECLEALDQVEAAAGSWLGALTPSLGSTPLERDGTPSSYAAVVARSAAHLFAHAGEMMAHASLYGVADLRQPGALAHVREAISALRAGNITS